MRVSFSIDKKERKKNRLVWTFHPLSLVKKKKSTDD